MSAAGKHRVAAGDLKAWGVDPNHLDLGASWDVAIVVGYTQKDAIQLYVEAGGAERGAVNYFRDFASMGGTAFSKNVPDPSRGIYLASRDWNARSFLEPKVPPIIEDAPEEAKTAAAAQTPPENYGSIAPGFTRATKIDEWKFISPFEDRAWADKMTAEVRMRKSDRRGRLVDHTGIEFVATSKAWFGEIVDSDVDRLLKKARQAFILFDISHRGIVWEDWIEVQIAPRDHGDRPDERKREEGLQVEFKIIKRGVDPRDGAVYMLDVEEGDKVVRFPHPKAAGEPDRHPKTGKTIDEDDAYSSRHQDGGWYHARDKRDQYAYIPATKENLAALEDLMSRMVQLRRSLAGVLEQKEIAKSLSGVAGRLLSFKEPS